MRKVNFNSLNDLQIPEEWTKKAVAIPENIEEPKKIPLVFSRRVLSFVACLLVVCLVAFTPFILRINKDILPVSTENTEHTKATQSVTENKNPTETVRQPEEKPTNGDTNNSAISENTEPSEIVEETKAPSSNSSVEEETDESQNPTQKPSETVPQEPVETAPPDSVETEPVEDFGPTQDNVINPDSPEDSSDISNPGDCIVGFSPSYLVGDGKIFCKIYDKDYNILGDSNIFSEQHRASFCAGFGSTYYYRYTPSKVGLNLEPGKYMYVFYNEHTVPICNAIIVIE